MMKKTRSLTFMYILTAVTLLSFIFVVFLLYFASADNCNCPSYVTQYVIQKKALPLKDDTTKVRNGSAGSHHLAVLVPYRERFEELLVFAPYLHKFLNNQQIHHHIFIIHQVDKYRFNRASLINIGYLYTKGDYDYIAMHDVDLLPLNKNLSYAYPESQPFHVAAPNLHPKYHYTNFVGGILLVNREHFQLVNGMSNNYWGWGLEDDEFFVRLRDVKLNITRPSNITTGTNNTFQHIHATHRKRDTVKCYNQREITRKRDRHTGLHDVAYHIVSVNSLTMDDAPVTIINVELICNRDVTPWCDCNDVNLSKQTHKKNSLKKKIK